MATNRIDAPMPHPVLRVPLAIFVLAIASALGWAVWSLPPEAVGLRDRVDTSLADSGTRNPVTAVIINFRGYDTMLEMVVLLLAVIGASILTPVEPHPLLSAVEQRPVLTALVRQLTPLMVLVAAYILWAGGHAPGGAFQGGAILGAAGVLLLLSGVAGFTLRAGWPLRSILLLGSTVFLLVAIGGMAVGGHLLEFPRPRAGALILLIETASMLSIGCMLALLFAGGPSARSSHMHHTASREHVP